MSTISDLHGFFNVDKPTGMTSHDVVARIRRSAGGIKVGHAGTLDPFASGVLVICVGRGTRLADAATAERKHYRATIILGIETDTYDRDGVVISRRPVAVERSSVEAAVRQLTGMIEQVPPMFSAIKVGGRKLYDIARGGGEIERRPRLVTIDRLEIVEWAPPRLTVEIECSKGTYVRSIAHDLGVILGTGGHVDALVRCGSGNFVIDEAVGLDTLLADLRDGMGRRWLIPLDQPILDLPAIIVDEAQLRVFSTGQSLSGLEIGPSQGGQARVYGLDGRLKGLAESVPSGWTPQKVFM